MGMRDRCETHPHQRGRSIQCGAAERDAGDDGVVTVGQGAGRGQRQQPVGNHAGVQPQTAPLAQCAQDAGLQPAQAELQRGPVRDQCGHLCCHGIERCVLGHRQRLQQRHILLDRRLDRAHRHERPAGAWHPRVEVRQHPPRPRPRRRGEIAGDPERAAAVTIGRRELQQGQVEPGVLGQPARTAVVTLRAMLEAAGTPARLPVGGYERAGESRLRMQRGEI